jgi:hypothetical protein
LLTGDGRVAERWRTRGNDRRRHEHVARVKEGAKELGKEGMRCGESRGSHCPFIGVGGAPERGGRGSNGGVNGGVVKARVASEVGLGGAGSGGRWWQRG